MLQRAIEAPPDTANGGRTTASGIEVAPEPVEQAEQTAPNAVFSGDGEFVNVTHEAAQALVETLFAGQRKPIRDVMYAVTYQLAAGRSGGDIVDVFHYDNDHVSLSIADIAGKGVQAATHASLIKYGLRALVSSGLTAENVLRGLDRLYLENSAFEETPDSFATVFFGVVDASRRFMQYVNAGHEPVMLVHPSGAVHVLEPTAPIVGIFEDQHHLFKQCVTMLEQGTILVATTDGVSEARNGAQELFGIHRIGAIAAEHRWAPEWAIGEAILSAVTDFCHDERRDDIAILVARFL